MIFSSSTYEQFKQRFHRKEFGSQRYGQAFHDFMKLDKSNDKEFCNKLYNAKDEEAKQLIEQHIDINQ